MALSTAKQWELLNTTLVRAVNTGDEDFPVMVMELMDQCSSLSRDNPPKATWKKLLQQNVPLSLLQHCRQSVARQETQYSADSRAVALYAAHIMLNAAVGWTSEAGTTAQAGSASLTTAFKQQVQQSELLPLLPGLFQPLTEQMQAVSARWKGGSAADAAAVCSDAAAAAERQKLALAAAGLQGIVMAVRRLWGPEQPLTSPSPRIALAVADLSFAQVQLLDVVMHQPCGPGEGTDNMLLGTELAIQANVKPLLAALLDAAAEPLLFQQLRTAFLHCWCWRLLVLALLQRTLQARTPGTSSNNSGDGADAAADSQALQLPPPLQKMLRQLGVSKKLVVRAGTECFPPDAQQVQVQMVMHGTQYQALDDLLQQLSETVQHGGSTSTQQQQRQQQQEQELVRTQLQLSMLIPGVMLQWASDLPADQAILGCRAACDAAMFANWHSQSLIGEQRRLREQQQQPQEERVTVGYKEVSCDDALPSGVLRDIQQLLCTLIPRMAHVPRAFYSPETNSSSKSKSGKSSRSSGGGGGSSSSTISSSRLEEADAARRGLCAGAALLLSVVHGLTQQKEWNFEPNSEDATASTAAAGAAAAAAAAAGKRGALAQLHTAVVEHACTVLQDYVRAELLAAQCKGVAGISALPAAVALRHINLVGLNHPGDLYTVGPLVDTILSACDPVSPAALQLFGLLCSQVKLSTTLQGISSGVQAAQVLSDASLEAVCTAAAAIVSACTQQGCGQGAAAGAGSSGNARVLQTVGAAAAAAVAAAAGAGSAGKPSAVPAAAAAAADVDSTADCDDQDADDSSGSPDVADLLPWVALLGNCCLQLERRLLHICGLGNELLQQPAGKAAAKAKGKGKAGAAGEGSEAVGAAGAAAAAGQLLTLAQMEACRDFADKWDDGLTSIYTACFHVTSAPYEQQLRERGYDLSLLDKALDGAPFTAAVADTVGKCVAAGAVSAEGSALLLRYVEHVHELGLVLSAFAHPRGCNNPGCVIVLGPSEEQAVESIRCICKDCHTARYCIRECQVQHWKQAGGHRAVCKALVATGHA